MPNFIKLNARWLAGCFLLALCSSFGQTFFVSLFSDDIRTHFRLSDGQFGKLYMMATLGSAAVFYRLGSIVDRFPVPLVATGVLLSLAVACCSIALVDSVWLLVICLFGLRLFGQGMLLHTSQTAIGRWFDARRGQAVSLTSMGLNAGEAVFPKVILLLLSASLAWTTIWIGAAVFAIALIPVCFVLLRVDRQPEHDDIAIKLPSAQKQWTRFEVLRDRLFWVACPGLLAPAFIATAIFFHHQHLSEIKTWDKSVFANGFVCLAVSTVASKLAAGALIDRFGAVRLMWVYQIPLGVSCAMLGVCDQWWIAWAAMSLIGVAMGFANSIFGTLWPEVYGTTHLGSVRSIAVAGLVFASALGSGLTGQLIDAGLGFENQLLVMAAWCAAAAISLSIVAVRMRKRLAAYLKTHGQPKN